MEYRIKPRHYKELVQYVKQSRNLTWGQATRVVKQQYFSALPMREYWKLERHES